jgi:hypothetical protein
MERGLYTYVALEPSMLDRIERLQRQRLMRVRTESIYLDSSIVKAHSNSTETGKKRPPEY